MQAWTRKDTICDFWLGPFGDHIYHFHKPHPDQPVFAGKPPHVRHKDWDPGAAYIAFVTPDSVWHDIIYRSAQRAFKGAPIHFVNAAPSPHAAPYPAVPSERQSHMDFIRALPEEGMRRHDLAISVDLGGRFLAKLALGFGALLLDPAFPASKDAANLRSLLWERDWTKRRATAIRGSGFLSSKQDLVDLFGWGSSHTFALHPVGNTLNLVAVFYGAHAAIINVSSESTHWLGRIGDSGAAWVIAPGLRRYAGPLPLAQFLVEKLSGEHTGSMRELAERIKRALRYTLAT